MSLYHGFQQRERRKRARYAWVFLATLGLLFAALLARGLTWALQ